MLDDLIQQIGDVVGFIPPVFAHPAFLGSTVNRLEIKLVFGRFQTEHQVEHRFLNFFGTAIGFVDLVDYYNGLQAYLQCFLQHKTCLWHGTFKSVHQEENSIGHVQHTFHLTTEVSVTWGIYDVDFRSFILNGNVFGKDRDATLAFQLIAVENQFSDSFVRPEQLAGQQHFVHQGSFTVVDVCNDGNVPNVLHFVFSLFLPLKPYSLQNYVFFCR